MHATLMQKKDRIRQLEGAMEQKCPRTKRVGTKCPKTHPWYSGVDADEFLACHQNPFCAAMENELYRIFGLPMQPVKYNA